MNEWAQAEQIVVRAFASIDQLAGHITPGREIGMNGAKAKAGKELWRYVKGTLSWMFVDAAARCYDPRRLLNSNRSKKKHAWLNYFCKLLLKH